MEQEPGIDMNIKRLVRDKYKCEFPLFSKINVNGPNTHNLYRYLRKNSTLNDNGNINDLIHRQTTEYTLEFH
jgi:glutathione peroxidase